MYANIKFLDSLPISLVFFPLYMFLCVVSACSNTNSVGCEELRWKNLNFTSTRNRVRKKYNYGGTTFPLQNNFVELS